MLERIFKLLNIKLVREWKPAPIFIFEQLLKTVNLLQLEVVNCWLDYLFANKLMERDFSSLISPRELFAYFCVPISQD
jgi:hypothetical protein